MAYGRVQNVCQNLSVPTIVVDANPNIGVDNYKDKGFEIGSRHDHKNRPTNPSITTTDLDKHCLDNYRDKDFELESRRDHRKRLSNPLNNKD